MTSDQLLSPSSEEKEDIVPGWIDYCMAIGSHYQQQHQQKGDQKLEMDEEEEKGDYEVSCQFFYLFLIFILIVGYVCVFRVMQPSRRF